MTCTQFAFAILVVITIKNIQANITNSSTVNITSILDPKRRHDLVDEAFLEQKDVLLDMLETKLKEVRDKKKKKSDKNSNNNGHLHTKCDVLPKNVELTFKTSGISAIGEAEMQLKFGKSGKGTLNMDASGISNVGQARVELGLDEGAVRIPGLENLYIGRSILNMCRKTNDTANKKKKMEGANTTEIQGTRRNVQIEEKTQVTSSDLNNVTSSNGNVTNEVPTSNTNMTNLTVSENATINIISN